MIPIRVFLLALILAPFMANAEIQVTTGPTPIPRGDALAPGDLTISNGRFAIAFAVETAPPWGVARGGIIDIALLDDGQPGADFASLVDFLPNSWSNWPTSYQRVKVVEQSADRVVVRIERDWGEVSLATTVAIQADDPLVHLHTTMHNDSETPLSGIRSGFVMWPDGGTMFGLPGMFEVNAGTEQLAQADWTAAYDEDWALGLHAPYSSFAAYDGQDRYQQHDLAPGASRSFEAWLQIEAGGSLAPFVTTELQRTGAAAGQVSGRVRTRSGDPVLTPAVIAYRDDQPYTWTIGHEGRYQLTLPEGEYQLQATAKGHAAGALQTVVVDRAEQQLDFADVAAPGVIRFDVRDATTEAPVDARIQIAKGPMPLIRYFGKSTLFTDFDRSGRLQSSIAPGDYVFEVSSGGGFVSLAETVTTTVEPDHEYSFDVSIRALAAPQQRGWFSADLHHHSDVLDGVTAADFAMLSQLAARLDVTFLSDHDSVINNPRMQQLAEERDVLFMAGTELSPSWSHFNAFPLDADAAIEIDVGQSSVQQIFAEARRMGADIIELNHPYMGYGYFQSRELEMLPGGYDNTYDLVEIEAAFHNGGAERNRKTLAEVWRLWNLGERKYLAAGSDAHDVWVEESGAARTYVRIADELSIATFVDGLRHGRSFASQGPLIYPGILFGSDILHASGASLALSYEVQSVAGLRAVQLISMGTVVAQAEFSGETDVQTVQFEVRPESDSWYSVVVADDGGNFAYSNPIWVTITADE